MLFRNKYSIDLFLILCIIRGPLYLLEEEKIYSKVLYSPPYQTQSGNTIAFSSSQKRTKSNTAERESLMWDTCYVALPSGDVGDVAERPNFKFTGEWEGPPLVHCGCEVSRIKSRNSVLLMSLLIFVFGESTAFKGRLSLCCAYEGPCYA